MNSSLWWDQHKVHIQIEWYSSSTISCHCFNLLFSEIDSTLVWFFHIIVTSIIMTIKKPKRPQKNERVVGICIVRDSSYPHSFYRFPCIVWERRAIRVGQTLINRWMEKFCKLWLLFLCWNNQKLLMTNYYQIYPKANRTKTRPSFYAEHSKISIFVIQLFKCAIDCADETEIGLNCI